MEEKKKKPVTPPTPAEFPMRLNRYLALSGKASRRTADKLIEHKWVKVNGHFAKLGDKVNEGDEVEIVKDKRGNMR